LHCWQQRNLTLPCVDRSIREHLKDGIKQGKANFLIDLGERTLALALKDRLEGFNTSATKYRVANLWIFTNGELVEINIKD